MLEQQEDVWLAFLSPLSRKRPAGYMLTDGSILKEGERVATPAGEGVLALCWNEQSRLGDLHLCVALDSPSPESAKCRKHWLWQKLKSESHAVVLSLGVPLESLYFTNGAENLQLERLAMVPPSEAAASGRPIRYRCGSTGCIVGPAAATLCATGEHVMCVRKIVQPKKPPRASRARILSRVQAPTSDDDFAEPAVTGIAARHHYHSPYATSSTAASTPEPTSSFADAPAEAAGAAATAAAAAAARAPVPPLDARHAAAADACAASTPSSRDEVHIDVVSPPVQPSSAAKAEQQQAAAPLPLPQQLPPLSTFDSNATTVVGAEGDATDDDTGGDDGGGDGKAERSGDGRGGSSSGSGGGDSGGGGGDSAGGDDDGGAEQHQEQPYRQQHAYKGLYGSPYDGSASPYKGGTAAAAARGALPAQQLQPQAPDAASVASSAVTDDDYRSVALPSATEASPYAGYAPRRRAFARDSDDESDDRTVVVEARRRGAAPPPPIAAAAAASAAAATASGGGYFAPACGADLSELKRELSRRPERPGKGGSRAALDAENAARAAYFNYFGAGARGDRSCSGGGGGAAYFDEYAGGYFKCTSSAGGSTRESPAAYDADDSYFVTSATYHVPSAAAAAAAAVHAQHHHPSHTWHGGRSGGSGGGGGGGAAVAYADDSDYWQADSDSDEYSQCYY